MKDGEKMITLQELKEFLQEKKEGEEFLLYIFFGEEGYDGPEQKEHGQRTGG